MSSTKTDQDIDIVIYGHSSFLEVLKIQLDHLIGKGKLTLFINKNEDDLDLIYEKFSKVVFYEDGLPYGKKLLSCLDKIDYEYFIFLHDNDIVYDFDSNTIKSFFYFLKNNKYDRIDFQLAYDFDKEKSTTINDDSLYFIKSSNTDTTNKGYIYNVNPSIWRLDTLRDIMIKFGHRDYRTIEHPEVQEYCLKYNIFKIYSKTQFNCGYFICLSPFKYIHITRYQKYLNLKNLNPIEYKDIESVYNEIIDKYNLKSSEKWEN
jgi:hypothetical protein